MKTTRFGWTFALLLCVLPSACILTSAQQSTPVNKVPQIAAPSAFEPLERWKAAVLAGDRSTIATFYTTSPPTRATTPQGATQDPAEEPAFWSSLRALGLNAVDIKVLEVKTPQPGVMSFVLRMEVKLRGISGERTAIISLAQVWVQQGKDWRIAATQRSDLTDNVARRLPEPAKPNTQLYPSPEEAPPEIAKALSAATKDHKRVILIFGGNWCYDCHVLDATFRSRDIAPLVNQNYHVVHINVGEYDKNLDLAKKYEIPLEKGVPSLAILDPDGKLLFSQKQGEFENTIRIGPADVAGFLQKWKPSGATN